MAWAVGCGRRGRLWRTGGFPGILKWSMLRLRYCNGKEAQPLSLFVCPDSTGISIFKLLNRLKWFWSFILKFYFFPIFLSFLACSRICVAVFTFLPVAIQVCLSGEPLLSMQPASSGDSQSPFVNAQTMKDDRCVSKQLIYYIFLFNDVLD